jgi:hypothetical protein
MFDFRRRRIELPGFRLESLEKNPNNPVNPVHSYFIKIESIPYAKISDFHEGLPNKATVKSNSFFDNR